MKPTTDPMKRPPEQVVREVEEGLLSVEDAREQYGIVLDGGEIRLSQERLADAKPDNGEVDFGIERLSVLHPIAVVRESRIRREIGTPQNVPAQHDPFTLVLDRDQDRPPAAARLRPPRGRSCGR